MFTKITGRITQVISIDFGMGYTRVFSEQVGQNQMWWGNNGEWIRRGAKK